MNVGRKYHFTSRMYHEDSGVVESVMAKLLRVLLNGHCHGLAHYMLKRLVNGGEEVHRMHKGMFEVALATLMDRGLVCWHGVGNWAHYAIPGHRKNEAVKLAYADFGGEVDVDSVLTGGCEHNDAQVIGPVGSRRGQKRGKARSSDVSDGLGKRIRRSRGQHGFASRETSNDPMSP